MSGIEIKSKLNIKKCSSPFVCWNNKSRNYILHLHMTAYMSDTDKVIHIIQHETMTVTPEFLILCFNINFKTINLINLLPVFV